MSAINIAPTPEKLICPLEVIEAPTNRCRPIAGNRPVTLDTVGDLLPSIQSLGLLVPGLCFQEPEGATNWWTIVAGVRRWYCCDRLGIPFKFLRVEGDISPLRLLKISITENVMRKNLSLLELADQIEHYAATSGITSQNQLAAELDMLEPQVSRARLLPKKLNPKLHEAVRNFEIGRSWAELIASLPTFELQETAAAHYFSFKPEKPKRDAFKIYIDSLKPAVAKRRESRSAKGKTAGGLGFNFSGTPESMVVEAKKMLKALETLIGNKWDLSMLSNMVRS